MYSYPIVIHFHRKNGDYAACSFSRKQADVKENLYYENDYFGAKFSFTVTSAERLDTLTFSVGIDGKAKDYPSLSFSVCLSLSFCLSLPKVSYWT